MAAKKILIVDDDTKIIKLVGMRLESNGYQVSSAEDGEEGLDKAVKEKPDLILLDIKMKQLDGYTTLRKLKADKATESIPVIMLTSYDRMKGLFQAEGITDYIVKPFDDNDLLLRISRALNKE